MIVANGILSGVQVASMSSKMPSLPVMVAGVIAFAAFIGTLLAAASMAVHACIVRSGSACSLARNLLLATAGCGFVVMLLTVGTFSALNSVSVSVPYVLGWLAADLAANAAIVAGSWRVAQKG